MFSLKSPAKITWELTTRCTRACHICYNDSGRDHSDPISRPQRESILSQIIASEALHVVLTGGEPLLLADELSWILAQLRSHDIYAQVWTNGDLLDEAQIQCLADCHLITLPLWGKDAESHDAVMGAGSFDAILNALAQLESSAIDVEIAWMLTGQNHVELDEAITRLEAYPSIRCISLYQYVQTGRGGQAYPRISREALEATITNVVRLNRAHAGQFEIIISEGGSEIRNLLRGRQFNHHVYVDADGQVRVHPYLPFTAGSMLSTPLADMWRDGLSTFWTRPEVKSKLRAYQNLVDLPPRQPLVSIQSM